MPVEPDNVLDLLKQLRSFAPSEQAKELDRLCGGDARLKEKVEQQLAQENLGATMAHATIAPHPTALAQLGSYNLVRKIGQGGMGEVYEARHVELDRVVALKTMRLDRNESDSFVSRFKRERRLIAQVDSPHVVRVTDAGFDSGMHFLVMERLTGNDLSSIIHTNGPIPVDRSAEMIRQALNGLAAINQCNLVHRDIKPSNLFLGNDGVVKILDLGLAKSQRSHGSPPEGSLTLDNQFVGTPDFVSPEQAEGVGDIDIRTDIYALGCVWYFLLTGNAPYSGDGFSNVHAKIAAHLKEPFPETAHLNLPPKLSRVLGQMVAKNRQDRAADPMALASEIEKHNGKFTLLAAQRMVETSAASLSPTREFPQSKDISISVSRRSVLNAGVGLLAISAIGAVALGWRWFMPGRGKSSKAPIDVANPGTVAEVKKQNSGPSNNPILVELIRCNPGLKPENCQLKTNEGGSLVLELESRALKDLAPIAKSQIEILMINRSSVSDLTPLAEMPNLQILQCTNTNVLKSLEPLRNVPLSNLQIHGTNVDDFSPIQGKKISYVDCHQCPIEDLLPLKGMPLKYLDIHETKVSDLSSLGEQDELEFIDCTNTQVVDLKPLMKFSELYTLHANERILRGSKFLLDHPNAKNLKCNGKSVTKLF